MVYILKSGECNYYSHLYVPEEAPVSTDKRPFITQELVSKIEKAINKGRKDISICKKYNVSPFVVSLIRQRLQEENLFDVPFFRDLLLDEKISVQYDKFKNWMKAEGLKAFDKQDLNLLLKKYCQPSSLSFSRFVIRLLGRLKFLIYTALTGLDTIHLIRLEKAIEKGYNFRTPTCWNLVVGYPVDDSYKKVILRTVRLVLHKVKRKSHNKNKSVKKK